MKRVIVDGWPLATVAEQLGISRATGYDSVRPNQEMVSTGCAAAFAARTLIRAATA